MSRKQPAERRDYSHEVRKHRFLWVQVVFAALGTLFLLIGIAGVFLPLLPTTPFLLLATACYARSSRRFYNWLMNHPVFGPLIIEWRTYHSIPWRIKLVAVTTQPCTSCMQMLCAYGIEEVYFRDTYEPSEAAAIADIYGVKLIQLAEYPRIGI